MRPPVLVSLLAAALATAAVGGCASSDSSPPGGERVAPQGAKYSYRVPRDFEAVDTIREGDIHSTSITSVASPSTSHVGAGIVVAQLQELPRVRSAAALRQLLPVLEAGINGRDFSAGAAFSKVLPARFPGHLAIRWVTGGFQSGLSKGMTVEETLIFLRSKGGAAQVSCRWGPSGNEQSVVRRGCDEVLRSLRVR